MTFCLVRAETDGRKYCMQYTVISTNGRVCVASSSSSSSSSSFVVVVVVAVGSSLFRHRVQFSSSQLK